MRAALRALALAVALVPATGVSAAAEAAPERVSRPGVYRGYSEPRYDSWVLSSEYVKVRDGTRLAIDVFRPAIGGRAAEGRFPVVWMHTPYRRAFIDPQGRRVSALERAGLFELLRHGYVIAAADTRGRGASFGVRRGFQDRTEANDAYDLTEWLAAQPWSSGKIGITGCSYPGGSTFHAATVAPPHLRAIAPGCSDYEKYGFIARGGILAQFNTRPENPEQDYGAGVAPVDSDSGGRLAAEAIALHVKGTPMAELWKGMPFRDDVSPLVGTPFWQEVSVASYRDVIEKSGVAIFVWGNWLDEGSFEAVLAHNNLRNPRKLWVGGFGHCQTGDFPMATELLRFFDRYLKDVDNGWDREPPIYFHTIGAAPQSAWRSAERWPLPEAKATSFHLATASRAGSAGELRTDRARASGADAFEVRYDVRCRENVDPYFIFWPCVIEDHGLSWQTAPLETDRHIAGHPVADLWISADRPDADVFVYLEDVAPDGKISILSHGRLRASHRREHAPPYREYMGLPYHRSFRADAEPLTPGEPARLRLDLLPTSTLVKAGHRIRFTVAGADPRQRFRTVSFDPPPTISVLRGPTHASSLSVPFVPLQAVAARKAASASDEMSAATTPAEPRGPIPVTDASRPFGAAYVPGAAGSIDLAARGYVEEEFFVSGTANRYAYDESWRVETVARNVPYVTRILVRRPQDRRRFSGIVHLEPAHPVLGGSHTWSAAHDLLMARGDAYVLAVVGEDALTRGGRIAPEREALRAQMQARGRAGPLGVLAAMRAVDPARYAPIAWPEDDAPRWDALVQIAALIRRAAPGDPLQEFEVTRLFASGWSFNGSLLRTFINEGFHERARDAFDRPLIDGYLIGISASAFVSGMVSLTTGAPVLPPAHPRRATRAIDVPVIELMSENEAATNTGPQPPERDAGVGRHRLYEVAGLSHGDGLARDTRENTTQVQLREKGLGAAAPADPCALEKSDVPMDALARAALANLHEWVERGKPPPKAARIDFTASPDAFGNRRGGVRVAQLDVPLATYAVPGDDAPEACRQSGAPFFNVRRMPLDTSRLEATYGTPEAYLKRFASRLDALVAEGWILREDAEAQLATARERADEVFATRHAADRGKDR